MNQPGGVGPVIVAVNPGSSSVKVAVRNPQLLLQIEVERLGDADAGLTLTTGTGSEHRAFSGGIAEALAAVGTELDQRGLHPAAVAHRVVHGGPRHYQPTVVDDGVLDDLRQVIPLAPLHLPGDLDSIGHARERWPDATHVACFDTGFHHDLPERSRRLPVSDQLVGLGIRRYGFHGLSVQSVLRAHPDLGSVVIAHLGSGCSVSAVADGRPRHTTMSLTPTGGLLSATRTGDLDPEVVLYLIEQHGFTPARLRQEFDHASGLAGIAGGRHDVRDLLAATQSAAVPAPPADAANAADAAAVLALDLFATDTAMAIAGCAATLDGWDSLVFTGGVGQHAEPVRESICRRLLGIRGATLIGGTAVAALTASGVRVLVVPADEELILDDSARSLIGA